MVRREREGQGTEDLCQHIYYLSRTMTSSTSLFSGTSPSPGVTRLSARIETTPHHSTKSILALLTITSKGG